MGAFEHLKKWREFVGYKSLNLNDKRTTGTYKVKKEKRLKSFIEIVTKKHMKRLQALAKVKGIDLKAKRVGEQLSSDEENEWEELNRQVADMKDKETADKRKKAKNKREEIKAKDKARHDESSKVRATKRELKENKR